MNKEHPNDVMIPIRCLKWLEKALSKENYHEALRYAHVSVFDGYLCLAATDTYRLHVLKVSKVTEAQSEAFKPYLLDVRRAIHEMRFHKLTILCLNREKGLAPTEIGNSQIEYGIMDYKDTRKKDIGFKPLEVKLINEEGLAFVDWPRVIPEGSKPPTEIFAFNRKYLSDAISIGAGDSLRTMMFMDAPNSPLILKSSEDYWFAVIMPMAMV